jgi:hypothetical protein
MTNTLAAITNNLTIQSLTVALIAATNWTGHINGTNELGYVVTNHVATIRYQGQTNEFHLKSVPTGIAVWRPQIIWVTNYLALKNVTTNSMIYYPNGTVRWGDNGFTNLVWPKNTMTNYQLNITP